MDVPTAIALVSSADQLYLSKSELLHSVPIFTPKSIPLFMSSG